MLRCMSPEMAHRDQSRAYNVPVAIRSIADIGWRWRRQASVANDPGCVKTDGFMRFYEQ
jgi:hypothetical protein